jgi:hypothetical protein
MSVSQVTPELSTPPPERLAGARYNLCTVIVDNASAYAIHRPTESPRYWSAFTITADDAEFLYGYILELGRPLSIDALALALIQHRIERENAELRQRWEGRNVYQPKECYTVGAQLVFPALQFATGRVIAIRPGRHPELGEFEVIRVAFDDGQQREFAARFPHPHRLNQTDVTDFFSHAQSPEALYAAHGERVRAVLGAALEQNREFIRIGNEWFLKAMMAEVNIGHLNLAEAVLDMANGGPLTTDVILRDLSLPPEIGQKVQEASLNAALAADPRFDEVGPDNKPAWFLRRLEPPEVLTIPEPLRAVRFFGQAALSDQMLALARELDDELDFDEAAPVEPAQSVRVILTFPHLRAGTLGWSRRVAGVLTPSHKPRIAFRLRDPIARQTFTAWAVREGRYIWGLGEWFKTNRLAAGAYVELTRSDAGDVILIDFGRHRPKREWVRVASVRDGRLHLETAQRPVYCDVDELMAVFVDDPLAFDALRERPRDVRQAVREAFPEVAKLSPQGNVHARTLYAVVNLITRCSPTDVFAALAASGAYVSIGDNYWHLA